MNTDSRIRQIEALETELETIVRQSDELQQLMQQELFFNTATADRRRAVGDGVWDDRRRGERRQPDRAGPGRRTLADRRVPLAERWPILGARVSELAQQHARLLDQKSLLETAQL